MIRFKIFLSVICLFAFILSADCEVFSLWPFGKGKAGDGKNISGGMLAEALNGKVLWTEPVKINGVDLKLTMMFVETNLSESLRLLKSLYPDAAYSVGTDSVLVTVTDKDGTRRRIYLVEVGGDFPVLQFSMTLPEKLPEKFDWPPALPLPSGSTPETAMVFPDRKSSYGVFNTNVPFNASLNEISKTLESSGWKSVAKESSNSNANGEIFIKQSPLSLFIVNFSTPSDGNTSTATVYTRPIEK